MQAVEQRLVASLEAKAVSQVRKDFSAETTPEGLSMGVEAALQQVVLTLAHQEAAAVL